VPRIEVEFVYPPRQMPRDLQISLDERAVDRLTGAHLLRKMWLRLLRQNYPSNGRWPSNEGLSLLPHARPADRNRTGCHQNRFPRDAGCAWLGTGVDHCHVAADVGPNWNRKLFWVSGSKIPNKLVFSEQFAGPKFALCRRT